MISLIGFYLINITVMIVVIMPIWLIYLGFREWFRHELYRLGIDTFTFREKMDNGLMKFKNEKDNRLLQLANEESVKFADDPVVFMSKMNELFIEIDKKSNKAIK